MHDPPVDVALSVFGKPRQTALAVLSLLRHSGERIGAIHVLVEKLKPRYDTISVGFIKDLSDKVQLLGASNWIGIDTFDMSRFRDTDYRHSLRYQHAWETTKSSRLLIIHNDVYFKRDIIADMLAAMGDHVAVGSIGQCWNCPARHADIVEALGVSSGIPCAPDRYADFKPTFKQLDAMYRLARDKGLQIRPYLPKWTEEFHQNPWPLPECRVTEFCCMINMDLARKATLPKGKARPFGAFLDAGSHNMDVGVAWFRDVNLLGMRARHFDLWPYLDHFTGHPRLFDEKAYVEAEDMAAAILRKEFPEEAALMRRIVPGLLD